MQQPEEIFMKSTLYKVLFLIGEHKKQRAPKGRTGKGTPKAPSQTQSVKSMKQIRGMIRGY